MNVSNRDDAREFLESADAHAGDASTSDYPATSALIGIGYALLDAADAIRERTASQVPITDVEAVLMRVTAAADGAPEQATQAPE